MSKMLTTKELAARCGRTRRTILNWRKKGLIPSEQICGRTYYNLDEIEKVLKFCGETVGKKGKEGEKR
jgi:DNA-binding transcriptional MerR regulator